VAAVPIAVLLSLSSACNRTPAPLPFAFLGGQVLPAAHLAGSSARLHVAAKILAIFAALIVAVIGGAPWFLVSLRP